MGSLAYCVLADAILIPPHPPIPLTNIKKVRVLQKRNLSVLFREDFSHL